MERTTNCLTKLARMNKTLRHEEADRVPVSDFFWGSFLERWRQDLGCSQRKGTCELYEQRSSNFQREARRRLETGHLEPER